MRETSIAVLALAISLISVGVSLFALHERVEWQAEVARLSFLDQTVGNHAGAIENHRKVILALTKELKDMKLAASQD